MFVLTEIKDTIKIEPSALKGSLTSALIDEINNKYANRVIHEVGLCIAVFDILKQEEAFIYHSDGCSYMKVHFRMVVFRPFIGEILTGKIQSSSSEGIKVSLEFFDDILILPEFLKENTVFQPEHQRYVWSYEGVNYELEKDDIIRFRVESEVFHESNPIPANRTTEQLEEGAKKPPYMIKCSAAEDGLGLISWW